MTHKIEENVNKTTPERILSYRQSQELTKADLMAISGAHNSSNNTTTYESTFMPKGPDDMMLD